jgi:uncharacterized protein YukE
MVQRKSFKDKYTTLLMALEALAKNQDSIAKALKQFDEKVNSTADKINAVLLVIAKATPLEGEPGELLLEYVKEQEKWLDSMKNLEEKSDNSSMEKTPTTETASPWPPMPSESSGSIL